MADGALSRKAMVVAAGNAVQMLIAQIAVNLFLVRLLPSQEVFGTYRQVWLLLNTLFPILMFGMHFAAYYYMPGLGPTARRTFVIRSMLVLLAVGAVSAALLWWQAAPLAGFFRNPAAEPVLRAAAPYLDLTLPASFLFHAFIAVDRQWSAVIWNLGFFIPQSVLIVLLVWTDVPLDRLFLSLALLTAVRGLVALVEIHRAFPRAGAEPHLPVATALAYAVPVGMVSVVAILGEKIDKYVVSAWLDPERFALYSVGAVEFPLCVLVATAAFTVMRPRIASMHHQGDATGIARFWRAATWKLALVIFPSVVYLALVATPLMRFLYTDAYVSADAVFRLYLGLTVFRVVAAEPLLSSTGRTRHVFWGGWLFLVLDLALNVALVRPLGLWGPPLGTVLATGLLTLGYVAFAARALRVSVAALLPLRGLLVLALLSALAGVPVLWVLARDWSPLVTLLAAAGAFSAAYLALVLGFRQASVEDFRRLLPGK